MARYSKHKFDANTERVATFSNALSHPARIDILTIISNKKHCSCGEVVNLLPYSQSTVSQHLTELKIAGLIDATSNKTKTIYTINQDGIDECVYRFTTFMKSI